MRWLDRLTDRSLAEEKAYVAGESRRVRWMTVRAGAFALTTWGSLVVATGWTSAPWWLHLVTAMLLGWAVGLLPMRTLRRALAYRNGWLDGRQAMVVALAEAMRRGMSWDDWLSGEYARDAVIMGVPPGQRDEECDG